MVSLVNTRTSSTAMVLGITKPCKWCGDPLPNHFPYQCRKNPKVINRKPLKRTPIQHKGKRTLEYEKWRDEVARPYLIEKYGEACVDCGGERCGNKQLDVDHIEGRGSHADLKMSIDNVQLLGRYPCHDDKTNHRGKYRRDNGKQISTREL